MLHGAIRVLLAIICIFSPIAARAGVILISQSEASLPPPVSPAPTRAITRGPRIEISDLEEGSLRSPLHFKLKFRAFNGAKIDIDTLSVTYLRLHNIDLTSRIRPYASVAGIDIPDAEVPPGEHGIRVDVKDSEGREATISFSISVARK